MVDENELLSKWYDLKETISKLENKLDEFKSHANDIMESRHTDTISNEKFVLQKRDFTRRTVTKNDLPENIWEQFSKETVCSAFYLTKKGEKRKSPLTKKRFRSPKNKNEKFCK